MIAICDSMEYYYTIPLVRIQANDRRQLHLLNREEKKVSEYNAMPYYTIQYNTIP